MTRQQYVTFIGGLINPLRQDLPVETPVSLVKAENVLLNEFGGISKVISTDLLIPKAPHVKDGEELTPVWTGPIEFRVDKKEANPPEDNIIIATVYKKISREKIIGAQVTFEGDYPNIDIDFYDILANKYQTHDPIVTNDHVTKEPIGREVINLPVIESLEEGNYKTTLLIFNWPVLTNETVFYGHRNEIPALFANYFTATFYYHNSQIKFFMNSIKFAQTNNKYNLPNPEDRSIDTAIPIPCANGIRSCQYIDGQLILTFYDNPDWIFASAKKTGDYDVSNTVADMNSGYSERNLSHIQPYNNFNYFVLYNGSERFAGPQDPYAKIALSNKFVNFIIELRGTFLGTDKGIYHTQVFHPIPEYKLIDATPTILNEAIVINQTLYYLTDREVRSVSYQADIENFASRRIDGGMATYTKPMLLIGGEVPYPWISFTTEEQEDVGSNIIKWIYIGRIYSPTTISFTRIMANDPGENTVSLKPFWYQKVLPDGIKESILAYPKINADSVRQTTQPINLTVDNGTLEYANASRWKIPVLHFMHSVAGFTINTNETEGAAPPVYNIEVEDTYSIGKYYLNIKLNPLLLVRSEITEEFIFIKIDKFPFSYKHKNIGNDRWEFFAGIPIVSKVQLTNLIGSIGKTGKAYDSTLGIYKSGGFKIHDRSGKKILDWEPPNNSVEPYLYTGKQSVLTATDVDDIVTFSIVSDDPVRFTLLNLGITYEAN